MPKNLIVCCDGTWNNPAQEDNGIASPTNVVKLYNALAENDSTGVAQLKYYHPGVGGEDIGWFDEKFGGAFGVGISRHIQSAYYWLADNYEEGDRIFLFGFSRGAFTVRSLGGFLNKGLLNLQGLSSKESWVRVKTAYEKGYRIKDATVNAWAKEDWAFFNKRQAIEIHFLGVWDTVGSLGIPDDLEIFNFLDDRKDWEFHDTELGKNVLHARHAMAIDEIRSCFTVTRWKNAKNHNDAQEVWFPGVHSDVGGGYVECDLSNGALKWMIEESMAFDLEFRLGIVNKIACNPAGIMHNSYKGLFSKLRSRPRNIPEIVSSNQSIFHESVFERQNASPIEYPPYHPTRILQVGQSVSIDIFARNHWNETHVYLKRGHEYTFSATGEWMDADDSCDWKGTQNDKYTKGDVIRGIYSFLGSFETMFNKMTNNLLTDFWGTKRVEEFNWFSLVGAIANDGSAIMVVANDGSPVPHQYIDMTQYDNSNFIVHNPGYLYCFPNDAWCFYHNNRGCIRLTITRKK